MVIDHKTLLHLPVYTKLGQHLGRVVGFEIDVATQAILRYTVASSPLARVWSKTLIIAASQVISIEKDKMVVEDSTIRQPALAKGPAPAV